MANLILSINDASPGQGWGMMTVVFIVFLVVCLLIGYVAVRLFRFIDKAFKNKSV